MNKKQKLKLEDIKDRISRKDKFSIKERKVAIKDINDGIKEKGGKITLKDVKRSELLERLLDELLK